MIAIVTSTCERYRKNLRVRARVTVRGYYHSNKSYASVDPRVNTPLALLGTSRGGIPYQ